MGGESTATVASMIRDVGKAVCTIEDRLAFSVDGGELGEALCELQGVVNAVSGLQRSLTVAASRSGVAQGEGLRTISQYVASRVSCDAGVIRRAERLGWWLRNFDLFAAESAVMSPQHLDYLRLKLDNGRTRDALVRDQQIFVDIVAHATWDEFITVTESWLARNDPDGEEPQDQIDKSTLSLRKGQGGRLKVSGETDAVSGQLLETAIDVETEKIRREDIELGIERSHGARRMAALLRLAERGAARTDGTYSTPLINLVMSQKILEWCLAQDAGLIEPGTPIPLDPNDPDGRCELIDGTPIHPHLVMALLVKSTIRRVVLDAKSRVLDVSYQARSFPEWIKTASLIQSRGRCDVPGCDAPHRWLQIDHVDPHSHGGQTNWFNEQPLCGGDNHFKSDQTGHIPWRDRPPPPRHPAPNYRPPPFTQTE